MCLCQDQGPSTKWPPETAALRKVGHIITMEEEERQLKALFDQQAAQGNLGQWYTDAANFLKRTGGHWWCQHPTVTRCLGEVLR